MKHLLFLILTFIGTFITTHSLKAQTMNDSTNSLPRQTVYAWQGKMTLVMKNAKREAPVSLQYQAYDSIPGRYHKQLLVGELKSTTTNEQHPLIGYVQNQTDVSYHFYGIGKDGRIQRRILTGANDTTMEGYVMRPGGDGYHTVLELHKKDTTISPTRIATTPDQIYGEYHYDFGPKQPDGHLRIHKNKDGTANFSIYSQEKDGGGHVEVHRDSIKTEGTSFSFDAKSYGVTIWSAQVQFYKEFAVVGFIKPNADSGKFGKRATIEGIFIKEKEKH